MSAVPRARRECQAAVLVAPRMFELRDREMPEPGHNEVRVRLQGCGICASSLPVWEGRPWFEYPLESGAPGHEGWGYVDAVGIGVEEFAVDDRVAFVSNHAFAQLDIAPSAAVVKLPSELDDRPFPGEPLGCAMNIFERSDIRADMSVAIVGGGFLGALLTQLATRAGAEVCVVSQRDYSLRVATEAGAAQVVSSIDMNAAKARALEVSGGLGFERVIEAAGVQATLDIASALTAEGARLVIAGYHQDGLRQVNLREWNWRGIDVINAHERAVERYAAGIRAAAQAVLDDRIDPFPLLTHVLPISELARGFELTRTRPDGFVKAIVTMEQAS